MNELITNEQYQYLVEQIKATITEAVTNSRWFLVEGYWNIGKLIREEYTENITSGLQTLAVDVGIGERTLWYALQFFDKYPILNDVPEGKAISWNKLITKYLPEHTEKEKKNEYQRIFKGIERWSKAIEGIIDQSAYDRISAHVIEIRNILEDYVIQEDIDDAEERNWMDIIKED